MSGVRREGAFNPMSTGSGTEWLPTLGVLWHVVQVPAQVALGACYLDLGEGTQARVLLARARTSQVTHRERHDNALVGLVLPASVRPTGTY